MKIIEKDILEIEKGFIFQQVNCQNKMNSGLAKQIREKWPQVYEDYKKFCYLHKIDFILLGKHKLTYVSENIGVYNIFGQLNFGYDGNRYTDYAALKMAFVVIRDSMRQDFPIYFPFNFGCDRGGADWNIVSKMIDYYFPDAIICKLPEK